MKKTGVFIMLAYFLTFSAQAVTREQGTLGDEPEDFVLAHR